MSDFRCDGLQPLGLLNGQNSRNAMSHRAFTGLCAVALVVSLFVQVGVSSDQHVLSELFEDSTVGENVPALQSRVAELSDEERYRILSDWVLPGDNHLHFRMQGIYTPTNAAPGVTFDSPDFGTQVEAKLSTENSARAQSGGELLAPAFDLVDVAKKIGRLDELRNRIAKITSDNDFDTRSQLSLLFLVELASDDAPAATAAMVKLFDVVRQSKHSQVSERWPETLALTRGVQHTPRLKVVGELLYLIYEKFVNDLNDWRRNGNEVWDNHFFALLGRQRLRETDDPAADQLSSRFPLKNWAAISTFYERTRGQGLPHSYWWREDQEVSSVSGHNQDYLMLRSPLTGNFEIECEVTSPLWKETELLVADRWIGPYWGSSSFEIGRVRWQMGRIPLDPPRGRLDEWTRFRVVVRDGVCTMFYNGRKMHEAKVTRTYSPWVAVRSDARNLGSVRNIRITGNPTVAETVNLALHADLPGWTSYQQGSVTKSGVWYQEAVDGNSLLIGNRKSELAGSSCESLLAYHRPMLEDGTIEYEFYYEQGKSHVYPTIDRLAFLLDPGGVDVHWVTDGKYDRTSLSPSNRSTEPSNRRGDATLPLKPQAWNKLRFTLRGDTVFLELNGEAIYERLLETTNQRTFGLFHYSDETEARVRNIVWSGNWPKQIPELHDQELFIPDHECLAGLDSLTEIFSHKFTDELPEGEIELGSSLAGQAIIRHPNGLRIIPPVRDQWTGIKLNYLKPIYGDFDATLRFEDLKMTYKSKGTSDQMLLATDESGITLRCARTLSADHKSYATAAMTLPLPDGKKRYITKRISDEAAAGTLRLVRRGAIVHSLIAHGDSTHFRYVGNFELPSAASAVRFSTTTNLNGGGTCDVVLNELTVRSNTTAFESQIDARVTSINQFIALLPRTHRHRFAANGAEGFTVVGEVKPVKTTGGLRARTNANQQTGGTTLSSERSLEGDFDLSVTLNPAGLVTTDTVSGTTSVSVESENEQATLTIRRTSKKSFEVVAAVQRGGSAEPQAATIASETVQSVDALRLVRIQKTILFVYSEGGLSRLLGQANFESAPVSNGGVKLRIEPQSGDVLWKSFEARTSAPGN